MRQTNRSDGYALITMLIVTLLVTGLVVGFISIVNTEQKIGLNDTDYSSAFYGAEGGLEKLNSDLSKLFQQSVFPTQQAVTDIQVSAAWPRLPNVTYRMYQVIGGQTTRLTAALTAVATTANVTSTTGWPDAGYFMIDAEEMRYTAVTATSFTGLARTAGVAHTNNVSVSRARVISIAEGPNSGLNAQVIPFSLEVIAQTTTGSEARLNREVQVALIPVFQFGVFSDSDLSFFAGSAFNFGGRVHTNGNLFLASTASTTLSQKVTVANHVIRQQLANGVSSSDRSGPIYVVRSAGSCTPSPGACRDLLIAEGSKLLGPTSNSNPNWPTISLTTYNGNILNRDTGAKSLVLPFAGSDVGPIEIIRRPASGEAANSIIGQSRLYNQASLRILISDAVANLPGAAGVPLDGTITGAPNNYLVAKPTFRPPFARANPNDADFITAANADETANAELIGGFIKIQRQNSDATWSDVTMEILNYGIATNQANAILRFQKPRYDVIDPVTSITATDYSPINMYDPRESHWRTTPAPADIPKIGIMNLIELDVAKLAQWFARTGAYNAGTGNQAISNNGYIVYFSDRRGNRDDDGNETAEFGFEDVVNPLATDGAPNGTMDTGENLNGNATLDVYGANLPFGVAGVAGTDIYTSLPRQPALIPMELAKGIDNAVTDIDLGSVVDFDTNPGYFRIDNEIMLCSGKETSTGNAQDTLTTCTRGAAGTAAAAHVISPYTELTADLTAATTNIGVASTVGLTTPGFFRIVNEYMYCTGVAGGNTLTNCERGRLGSAAAVHNRAFDILNAGGSLTNSQDDIDIPAASMANFTLLLPGYFRMENEIINCTHAVDADTLRCGRGAMATAAVAHSVTRTVNLAMTTGATTITLNNAADVSSGYYKIQNEIVRCTGVKVGNVLQTCARGQAGGGVAATHAVGTAVKPVIDSVEISQVKVWPSQRAAKNRVHYFRRALRLIGGGNTAMVNNLPTPGLTVAAENPVYVLGNYNAYSGATGFDGPHSFSAVIADAVTLLSNTWDDNNVFQYPGSTAGRVRTETNYRIAIAAGKGINFPRPANYTGDGDFGTDGGTHNFLRYLEQGGANIWYRGSIVSLYYYRQATGTYKCCSAVYGAPGRQYAFDTDFLVPSQLPPGTPRFRDINNLSFRQTIRADQ